MISWKRTHGEHNPENVLWEAEPPLLSITRPKPIVQYKKLSKKFPVNFTMIILGIPLFESGFLAGSKHHPLISFSLYQNSCPSWACMAWQQWNSLGAPPRNCLPEISAGNLFSQWHLSCFVMLPKGGLPAELEYLTHCVSCRNLSCHCHCLCAIA